MTETRNLTETTRILIVDDSEDDRQLYRRALQRAADLHCEIVEADDGEQGLARIQEKQPDCILLDYSLPGRNGIEVLKRLRAVHPFIPVVMLTGQGNEAVAVAAMREGAQDYIVKATITPDAIQRAIRVAVEHCAMEKRIHDQRESLEIFTRALAHDLKEPIRTIRSFLALIPAEDIAQKARDYFRFIGNAADRMASLIDAVYSYTRLDGLPQDLSKEDCDVASVLDEVRQDLSELMAERHAAIANGPLPRVSAHRTHLLQVLQNLICNAINHCSVAPVIHVDAVEEADYWRIRVADNGPGVEGAQRRKIFEPFTRLAGHRQQGLGMGLAICRRIVESHGGHIWCEEREQGGTVFLFTLPKEIAAAPSAPVVASPFPVGADAAPSEDGVLANILLVEDNEADIELLKIRLFEVENLRCNLMVAKNAYEALTMIRGEKAGTPVADLILLDINMPGMDGLEMLSRMHADESLCRLPVIMCTTSSHDKDVARAKALGARGYVTKPAGMSKLKPLLETLESLRLRQADNGYTLVKAA